MAYLKPNLFVSKVFNRIAMATGMGGAETLAVTGRRTGKRQEIPVIPVEVDGASYIVCPRGETDWVRNVRVNPTVTITNKRGSTTYTATELPLESRGAVIAAYRRKAGRTVEGYWKQLPDEKDHPTFRLTRPAG